MLNFQVGRISIVVGGSWWKGDVNRNEQLPECKIHDAEALFQSSVRVYGRKSFSEAPLQMRREMWELTPPQGFPTSLEVCRILFFPPLSWTMTINHDEDDDYDRLWRWLWSSKMNVINPNNKPSSKSSFVLRWNHPQPGLPSIAPTPVLRWSPVLGSTPGLGGGFPESAGGRGRRLPGCDRHCAAAWSSWGTKRWSVAGGRWWKGKSGKSAVEFPLVFFFLPFFSESCSIHWCQHRPEFGENSAGFRFPATFATFPWRIPTLWSQRKKCLTMFKSHLWQVNMSQIWEVGGVGGAISTVWC